MKEKTTRLLLYCCLDPLGNLRVLYLDRHANNLPCLVSYFHDKKISYFFSSLTIFIFIVFTGFYVTTERHSIHKIAQKFMVQNVLDIFNILYIYYIIIAKHTKLKKKARNFWYIPYMNALKNLMKLLSKQESWCSCNLALFHIRLKYNNNNINLCVVMYKKFENSFKNFYINFLYPNFRRTKISCLSSTNDGMTVINNEI